MWWRELPILYSRAYLLVRGPCTARTRRIAKDDRCTETTTSHRTPSIRWPRDLTIRGSAAGGDGSPVLAAPPARRWHSWRRRRSPSSAPPSRWSYSPAAAICSEAILAARLGAACSAPLPAMACRSAVFWTIAGAPSPERTKPSQRGSVHERSPRWSSAACLRREGAWVACVRTSDRGLSDGSAIARAWAVVMACGRVRTASVPRVGDARCRHGRAFVVRSDRVIRRRGRGGTRGTSTSLGAGVRTASAAAAEMPTSRRLEVG